MDVYQSLYDFIAEARNYSIVFWLLLSVYSGSLKRIDYPKQACLAHPYSFECFTAFKGTHFYIFIHAVPPWEGGKKVYINGPGHMTKMADMPIYGKTFKDLLLQN